jgi:hypothetical protein
VEVVVVQELRVVQELQVNQTPFSITMQKQHPKVVIRDQHI